MKNILTILLLIINIHCFGQSMIVNQEENKSFRSYRYDKIIKIDSLSELPSIIQLNTNGYLKRLLGSMSDSIQFSHGQETDLKALFKKDSITFEGNIVKPKYILHYTLSDNSIGIKRYNLSLELNEYGQLLKINWPKKKYNNKSSFISRDEIKQFAITQAKLRRIDTSFYKVSLIHETSTDRLCWQFIFPDSGPIKTRYNKSVKMVYTRVLMIDWCKLKIIGDFRSEFKNHIKYAHPG